VFGKIPVHLRSYGVENRIVRTNSFSGLHRNGSLDLLSIVVVTPLELGAQVVVLVLLLGDDVALLLAGDMNDALPYLKDVAGIGVQPRAGKERVKWFRSLPSNRTTAGPCLGMSLARAHSCPEEAPAAARRTIPAKFLSSP
jgi:hypothetical protein